MSRTERAYCRHIQRHGLPDIRCRGITDADLLHYLLVGQQAPLPLRFSQEHRKPAACRLPGLFISAMGRYPNGRRVWSFCLDGLLAN